MKKFVVRRMLQSILLLWFVMSLSFLLVHIVPGGPERTLMTNPRVTEEDLQAMRQAFGLNDPLYVQYGRWLVNSVTLNFGLSYKQNTPVLSVIGERIWPTIQLGIAAYLIGLIGIPLGIYAARHRGKMGDNAVRVMTVMGSAMPSWWLALMLIVILSNTVGWFPQGQGVGGFGPWLLHLIVPAALLSTTELIRFSRFVRSETLEVLSQDYVRTANAKGLSPAEITRRHVLRNSLIPVVTLFGSFLPTVLSGAIITETIFNWPGMGRLFFESAYARDYPVVLTILLITTFFTILGTFLADIAYGYVDPRIHYR
jgi:peptide/nickel transport system permease protein